MTPQELKNSILQLAIQGKLVEQRPEEGTGEELYRQIQKEKQELIKAGTIKKEKPLPAISEDDIPFEIPESWKWIRLCEISKVITKGTTPRGGNVSYLQNGIGFLRAENVAGLDRLDKTGMKFIDEKTHTGFLVRSILEADDILITIAGTLGRTGLVRSQDLPLNANQAVALIRLVDSSKVNLKYLVYSLNAASTQKALTAQKKVTAIPNLTLEIISFCAIPIPPLAEQKRIVAKIEELLPMIDRYEKAWGRLEDFNKRFPVDMQKSILQMAIQGKLVEQRSEEGTGEELYQQIQAEKQKLIKEGKIKKEKPLPEISEDEIPFDIPESWKWVRLRSLGTFSSGKTPTMGESKYWDNGTISWITSKDMKKKYLNSSEMLITDTATTEMRIYPQNTILMVVRSGILKRQLPVAILTGPSTINQDIKALSLYIPSFAEYVYCILKGMETHILKEYRKQVTTVDSLRFEDFQNMPVPLPPLAEQKRIVAKLEEILPLCEKLK